MTVTSWVVDRSIFAELSPPRLAGSRCTGSRTGKGSAGGGEDARGPGGGCGTTVFPSQPGCPRCGSDMAPVALPDHGTIWTWTVQRFEPKPPYRAPDEGFSPYAIGYVDLGDVLVEARLGVPHDRLRIGLPVRLALLPVWRDEVGADVATYGFVLDEGARS